MGDIGDDIKRYLITRYREGMEVAYRLDETAAAPEVVGAPPAAPSPRPALAAAPEPAARPGVSRTAATALDRTPSPTPAEHVPAEPLRSAFGREIPVLTTPLPADDIGGGLRRAPKGPSIRYTTGPSGPPQASLFGEPGTRETFDLGGCDLAGVAKLVSICVRCELSRGRTLAVFGSGNPHSKIVFLGEGPGREEDLQGLPFVGRAGQLLTKILAAMGLTRDEVYIANMVKCRPPNNREPQEDEMAACEPYLIRQLELIKPTVICCLGRIAGHGLLKTQASLASLRQGIHYYNDIRVAVTYHPAALLRNPNLKRDAWEDFQMVRRLYDEAPREGA